MNAVMTPKPRMFPIGLLILVMLAVLIVPALQVATDAGVSMHAVSKHGTYATLAQKCKGNPDSVRFHNPVTQRTGLVCQVDGKWAVVIMDRWGKEVTSFVKEKMHTFEQVTKYMKNAGYGLMH
jgi:hypothetical protein